MATNSVEVHLVRLEGAFEQITAQLTRLEARMDEMAAGLREEIGRTRAELLTRMDHQFFCVLGLLVVSILIPIAHSISASTVVSLKPIFISFKKTGTVT